MLVGRVLSRRAQTAGGDEPNASMASGMVLKAGLEVPFGCWWGDIVGGCLVWIFSEVSRLALQWCSSVYVSTGRWYGMVWYPRTVSLSRKVPNADVARCTMQSDYSFSPQVAVGWSRCIRVRRYVQNSAVAGPDKYM